MAGDACFLMGGGTLTPSSDSIIIIAGSLAFSGERSDLFAPNYLHKLVRGAIKVKSLTVIMAVSNEYKGVNQN